MAFSFTEEELEIARNSLRLCRDRLFQISEKLFDVGLDKVATEIQEEARVIDEIQGSGLQGVDIIEARKNSPGWVCEYCYKQVHTPNLPKGWDLVFQSALCPVCITRAKLEHPHDWISVVVCGEYANGKPDPRAERGVE